jgi:hypothetical protein
MEHKWVGAKVIRTRTKIEAVLAVAFLLAISISSVFAVTRTISDTQDTIATYITNSNGKYWAATGANLQLAITDLNSTNGGWVDFPGGIDMTVSSSINIWRNITVDFHGSTLTASGDIDVLIPWWQSTIRNVIIDISVVTFTNTSAAIKPKCDRGVGLASGNEGFDFSPFLMGENIDIISANQRGIGIYIHPTANAYDYAGFTWRGIKGYYTYSTIYIDVDTAGTYVNFNRFEDIFSVANHIAIWLEETTVHEITMNIFTNFKYEAESIGNEIYPITLEGNCNYNNFYGVNYMDWTASGESTQYIRIDDSDANNNIFTGPTLDKDYIFNNGSYNTFYGTDDTKVNNLITTNFNTGEAADVGVKFFYGCANGANAYVYIYGDDGGSDKFGFLRVDSSGNFVISSDTGENMILSPAQGANTNYVTIDDIMKLNGRTTHPTSPVEGMVYYNTTSNLLMLYTTAWHSIDIT